MDQEEKKRILGQVNKQRSDDKKNKNDEKMGKEQEQKRARKRASKEENKREQKRNEQCLCQGKLELTIAFSYIGMDKLSSSSGYLGEKGQ